MKKLFFVLIIVLFVCGLTTMDAQIRNQDGSMSSGQRDMAGNPIRHLSRLELQNPGGVYFDVDSTMKHATMFFGNNPVYSFTVRKVNARKFRKSAFIREFVLTANTDQRIIIDRGAGKSFLKIKKNNGGVQKVFLSRISVENLRGGIIRFHLHDNIGLSFTLFNEHGRMSSAAIFKGVPIFIMAAQYENVSGGSNMSVVRMKGNTMSELYLNRAQQTLYFKSQKNRGVWTRIKVK